MSNRTWRKSSFSGTQGNCVELADHDDHIAVRNSNNPDAGTIHLDRAQFAAWLERCKAGEFDGLTGA